MLETILGEPMDGIGTGACIALCSVAFSIDGSGESESRFWNQYFSKEGL